MIELRIKNPFPKVIYKGEFTIKLYDRIFDYIRRSERTVEIWKSGITGTYLFEVSPEKVRLQDAETEKRKSLLADLRDNRTEVHRTDMAGSQYSASKALLISKEIESIQALRRHAEIREARLYFQSAT